MLKKIFVGLLAGAVSGFFGSGGGLILVPIFVHIFDLDEKEARATSLFVVLPMVITSMFFYVEANYIDWSLGIRCAIGGAIGGYIGARILKKASNNYLQIFFIIFLIYVSIKMIFF